ncbi:MAG: hypothetical protein ACPG7F_01555 [Aggregatilineales bacterium]
MHIPVLGYRLRLLSITYGLMLLVWLSTEDNSTLTVALLGTGLAILSVLLWLLQHYGGQVFSGRILTVGAIFIGAITGAGAVLATVLLMFLKTAWHSHIFPDYPAQMMLDMLTRLPVWALAGGLLGLSGLILLRQAEL